MLLNQVSSVAIKRRHAERLLSQKDAIENEERELLLYDLKRAVMLGNSYNESAIVKYVDAWGALKKAEDIVQAATERYVLLKGGRSIPIQNVKGVIV